MVTATIDDAPPAGDRAPVTELVTELHAGHGRSIATARAAWPLWAGVAALALPTIYSLATLQWIDAVGAFDAIILLLALWLVARAWPAMRAAARPPRLGRVMLLLVPVLASYVVARLGTFLGEEALLVYAALLIVVYAQVGARAMRAHWFALGYALLAMPFDTTINQLTQGLRLWLCTASVRLLHAIGYPVGTVGQTIFVDGYSIVLKEACAGLGSILSLGAVGLFYVVVNRGQHPAYVALCGVVMMAMAIAANFARIVALVLTTHYFGDAVAQSFLHETAGLFMFAVAVGGVILFDAAAWPLIGRRLARVHG